MKKLNYVPGTRLRRGSQVYCYRLTSNQTYIITDIYEESKGVVTVDLRLPTGRDKVASVPANDVYPLIAEGKRHYSGGPLNG